MPLLTLLRADELVDKPVGGMTRLRGCMGCRGIVQRRCGGGELIGAAEQRAGLAYQRRGESQRDQRFNGNNVLIGASAQTALRASSIL